ncbi:hypothetical protein EDE05_1179 [Neorhizobium sp. R1-B]|nr:hypothetical protein EDE05_1179 [Neorhizobium sp. R1-B]
MSSKPLALVEDLDRIGGYPRLDLLSSEAIGNGIVVPLDLDVIQTGPSDTPFGKHIAFERQWSQSRTIKVFEQLAALGTGPAQDPLIVQVVKQFADRRIDLSQL